MTTNIPVYLMQGSSDKIAPLSENRSYLLDNISDSSAIRQIDTFNWGHYGFVSSRDNAYLSRLANILAENEV